MKLQVLNNGVDFNMPSHSGDAGYDVVATSGPKICGEAVGDLGYASIKYVEYETNLFIAPEESNYTLLYPRSSISKYNLVLANSVGVVDQGYRNQILVRFKYIIQPKDLRQLSAAALFVKPDFDSMYKIGDKIAQLVFAQRIDAEICLMDALGDTSRGLGGFGSTGK